MTHLIPCPFCGQTPWVEYGTDVSYGIRMEHLCRTTPCETEAEAAAEWNAANAPADPALLALVVAAREWSEWVGFVHAGSPESRLLQATRDALLAPDGAASEVTDGD